MKKVNTGYIGFLFVLAACLAYGVMPSLTQLSYKAGLAVSTMLFGRLALGALIIWLVVIVRRMEFKIPKKLIAYLLFVGCSSVVQMTTMSESYRFLPGAIVSLLLFMYISVVVVIEILIGREKFNIHRMFCLAGSFIGLVLVILTPGQDSMLSITGILLALCAAVFYAFYALGIGKKEVRALNSEIVICYALFPPIIFSLIRNIASGEPILPQTVEQAFYIFLLGFVCTFFAAVCFAKGVKYIGASNAALFNTLEPVIAYFAGILFMNDKISGGAILGGILILCSVAYLNFASRAQTYKT